MTEASSFSYRSYRDNVRDIYTVLYGEKEESSIGDGYFPVCKGNRTL